MFLFQDAAFHFRETLCPGGQSRIRTLEGTGPADLQSALVDRLSTSACQFILTGFILMSLAQLEVQATVRELYYL